MTDEQQDPTTAESMNKGDESSPLHDFIHHQRKACEETGKAFAALLPPEFRTHSHAAKEEFLTSFKVLVDGVSAAVDREMKKSQSANTGSTGPSTTGKSKVKVEVS
jgi:hypothetical protein